MKEEPIGCFVNIEIVEDAKHLRTHYNLTNATLLELALIITGLETLKSNIE